MRTDPPTCPARPAARQPAPPRQVGRPPAHHARPHARVYDKTDNQTPHTLARTHTHTQGHTRVFTHSLSLSFSLSLCLSLAHTCPHIAPPWLLDWIRPSPCGCTNASKDGPMIFDLYLARRHFPQLPNLGDLHPIFCKTSTLAIHVPTAQVEPLY